MAEQAEMSEGQHPFGPGSHSILDDVKEMPECYPIKGNIRNDGSRLYHRPDSRNYSATKAEVWFDSPSAAEAAGFELSPTHAKDSIGSAYEPGGAGHPCTIEQIEANRVAAGGTALDSDVIGDGTTHPFGPGSHAALANAREMPACYPIKGNIRDDGTRLYHRPDSRNYGATKAEVWFDSPSAAEAAGFSLSPTHPKKSSSDPYEVGGDGHPCTAAEVEANRSAVATLRAGDGSDSSGTALGLAGAAGLAGAGAAAAYKLGGAGIDTSRFPFGIGSLAPLADAGEVPEGHLVKGTIEKKSKFYHRPDSRSYGSEKAAVWFDSPSAAEAAGFELASTHPEGSDGSAYEPGGSGHPWSVEQVEAARFSAAGIDAEAAAGADASESGSSRLAGAAGLGAAAAGAGVAGVAGLRGRLGRRGADKADAEVDEIDLTDADADVEVGEIDLTEGDVEVGEIDLTANDVDLSDADVDVDAAKGGVSRLGGAAVAGAAAAGAVGSSKLVGGPGIDDDAPAADVSNVEAPRVGGTDGIDVDLPDADSTLDIDADLDAGVGGKAAGLAGAATAGAAGLAAAGMAGSGKLGSKGRSAANGLGGSKADIDGDAAVPPARGAGSAGSGGRRWLPDLEGFGWLWLVAGVLALVVLLGWLLGTCSDDDEVIGTADSAETDPSGPAVDDSESEADADGDETGAVGDEADGSVDYRAAAVGALGAAGYGALDVDLDGDVLRLTGSLDSEADLEAVDAALLDITGVDIDTSGVTIGSADSGDSGDAEAGDAEGSGDAEAGDAEAGDAEAGDAEGSGDAEGDPVELKASVLAALAEAGYEGVDVEVDDGIVTLTGEMADLDVLSAVEDAVAAVAGVSAIDSQLTAAEVEETPAADATDAEPDFTG